VGVFDMVTEMTLDKPLVEVTGRCAFADAEVRGYEMHIGCSRGLRWTNLRFISIALGILGRVGVAEGAWSVDDQILETYLHGVFDAPGILGALLSWGGLRGYDGEFGAIA
ncbi:MAG: hypothetical protein H7240_02325, partial [Glaciimonas sp.]|nr:hypothetical protein [Glaciimonas sp.]